MDWILWIIPPFPIKHQKDDDDDDGDDDDDDADDDESLEVWSNGPVAKWQSEHATSGSNDVVHLVGYTRLMQGLILYIILKYD